MKDKADRKYFNHIECLHFSQPGTPGHARVAEHRDENMVKKTLGDKKQSSTLLVHCLEKTKEGKSMI